MQRAHTKMLFKLYFREHARAREFVSRVPQQQQQQRKPTLVYLYFQLFMSLPTSMKSVPRARLHASEHNPRDQNLRTISSVTISDRAQWARRRRTLETAHRASSKTTNDRPRRGQPLQFSFRFRNRSAYTHILRLHISTPPAPPHASAGIAAPNRLKFAVRRFVTGSGSIFNGHAVQCAFSCLFLLHHVRPIMLEPSSCARRAQLWLLLWSCAMFCGSLDLNSVCFCEYYVFCVREVNFNVRLPT